MEFRGIIYVAFCFLWSCGQARPGQGGWPFLTAGHLDTSMTAMGEFESTPYFTRTKAEVGCPYESSLLAVIVGRLEGPCQSRIAPSKLLVSKWKARFAVHDVNHDSVLSFADATEMSNTFTYLNNMTVDEAQYTGARIASMWTTCVGTERTGDIITEDDFLAEYTDAITNDPEAFETLRRDCFYVSANIADVDGDVHISESEWSLWCQSFGIDGGLGAMFEVFQPINERVPIASIVEEFVEFVTDEENIFHMLLEA